MSTPVTENLADALSACAAAHPRAPAVIRAGQALSFGALEAMVWRAARSLRDQGLAPGQVVALTFSSELAHLVLSLAIARIGATVIAVPVSLPPLAREELLEQAQVSAVLTDQSLHAPIVTGSLEQGPGQVAVQAQGRAVGPMPIRIDERMLLEAREPIDPAVRDPAPQAPWLLISGSGSTGRSKLIPVSHAQYLARMRLVRDRYPHAAGVERVVSLVHLDYPSAKNLCFEVLFAGGAVVLFDRARADVIALCRRARATVLWASVFHLETLLRRLPEGGAPAFAGLRILYVGSSTVTEALRARVARRLTPNLHVRYGTNESGVIAIATPEDIASTPGGVGQVVPGVEVEIVDPAGRPVPQGAVGRLRVRSPAMFEGYLGDDEATREAFADGWFVPGDLLSRADDGQLVYCGRADHLMIMNGINIYPAEIERVVGDHPAVRDVAAIPAASAVNQSIPVCVVALVEGARVSAEALREYAAARLGARGPRRVVIVDRIPRNALGKLIRPELVAAVAAALGSPSAAEPPSSGTDR